MSFVRMIADKVGLGTKAAESETGRLASRFVLHDAGFHGDRYLMELAGYLLDHAEVFVETGANVGSTLTYVARQFPELDAFSCEPDGEAFAEAKKHVAAFANVHCVDQPSPPFLETLIDERSGLLDRPAVFWLDAHGYGFDWPLRDEVRLITERFRRAAILIDDFRVPGRDEFKWDRYKGHECSFAYIEDSLAPGRLYHLYYPNYRDRTSKHHPLTGWGLLDCGFGADIQKCCGAWTTVTSVGQA